MAANGWFCQFLADVLEARVERPVELETTALGAAFLAGLATGVWKDLAAVAATWETAAVFTPKMTATRRAALIAGWRLAVSRTLQARRRRPDTPRGQSCRLTGPQVQQRPCTHPMRCSA